MYEKPQLFRRYIIWILLFIIVVVVVFSGMHVYLNWTILQVMYDQKAHLNWFSIVFYYNYTFILAAILSLLTLNPLPGRSDFYEAIIGLQETTTRFRYTQESTAPPPPSVPSLRRSKMLWAFWQLVKWVVSFSVITSLNGLPFLGEITLPFYMMVRGFGDWGLVPKIFSLPIMPASGSELVALMPTMEIQYRVLYAVLTAVLMVIVVRMSLKLIRHFFMKPQNTWVRDIFVILTCIVLAIILGAPYWVMDATTPFDYFICIILLVSFLVSAVFFQVRGIEKTVSFAKRRRLIFTLAAVAIIVTLGVNVAIIGGYRLNWNNNWIQYEWGPLTEKQIAVTRWSVGIQGIEQFPIAAVPTGNVTKNLSLVRQWDQTAAHTKMVNQIGVNWLTLSDSDIIYMRGQEYWAAPTTILYPSQDWISTHLIYTHSSKIIVIDSHTGEFVPVTEAFGVETEPLIYYGEGFDTPVYTGIKGFNEIGNVSYSGQPDYTLSGWQRMLWFLLQGQVGFAFTPPQSSTNMLYNRDVLQRVRSILIKGLRVDPDTYLVSDGNRVYYAVQVYIDYPMHSGFSPSPYLRYFAIVLVDIEDGSMHKYLVSKPDGFLVDFYTNYYSSWEALPNWLIPQMRYSEAVLGMHDTPGQLDFDFIYHVNDPFVWRSGSQFYERPIATEVLYVLMTVQNEPYFIGLQLVEYLQSQGRNLAGLYIAYGGPQLGQIELYEVPNATTQFIGPSAALQALETDDYVRTELTLLTNPRFGNILLYSTGNQLYYFIPVYIEAEIANAVITKMAFVGVIDAATGTKVAIGADSAQAYYALTGITPDLQTGAEDRLNEIKGSFTDKGYSLVNPTAIHAQVEFQVNNVTYVNEGGWNQTEIAINQFIQNYVQGYGTEVYYWSTDNNSTVNFGNLISQEGIVKLYYLSIQYR